MRNLQILICVFWGINLFAENENQASLENIWRVNASRSVTLNSFNLKTYQGNRGKVESLVCRITFPQTAEPGKIHVNITNKVSGIIYSLFLRSFENTSGSLREGELVFTRVIDGKDFKITINSYGEMHVEVWLGYGRYEDRHALVDSRHSYYSSNTQLAGALRVRKSLMTAQTPHASCVSGLAYPGQYLPNLPEAY